MRRALFLGSVLLVTAVAAASESDFVATLLRNFPDAPPTNETPGCSSPMDGNPFTTLCNGERSGSQFGSASVGLFRDAAMVPHRLVVTRMREHKTEKACLAWFTSSVPKARRLGRTMNGKSEAVTFYKTKPTVFDVSFVKSGSFTACGITACNPAADYDMGQAAGWALVHGTASNPPSGCPIPADLK